MFKVGLWGGLAAALLLAAALAHPSASARAETAVDLELVLAIDGSASVDEHEYRLQMQGIARAIRDAEVVEIIRSGKRGRIAIAFMIWADATVQKDFSPWSLIGGQASADAFAGLVAGFPRRVRGGTGIGAGIAEAIRMFDRNGFRGDRRVVDVSGDGSETPPREITLLIGDARAMAMARGVTVNGLAIQNEERELATWYLKNVITGPNAFVMAVTGYEDFAVAIKRKLIREIENLPKLSMMRPAS